MSASPYSVLELKRNAWHLLVGKLTTAILTFAIVLTVVRMLPIEDYGIYVTATAGVELIISVAVSGFSWVAHRYIPEFRLHASGLQTRRLVQRLFGLATGTLVAIAVVLHWSLDMWLGWARLDGYAYIARIALVWLVVEGAWRFVRDAILGPLLLQGYAQTGMAIRSGAMLLFLAGRALFWPLELTQLIWAEVLVSLLALCVGMVAWWRHINELKGKSASKSWSEPGITAMILTGRHMLSSQLLVLLYSPQIFLLVVQRYLGIESAAVFGFMRSLYEQVGRYLPATLLFTVIRPKLVASFVGGGAAREANVNANTAGKLSLFALMPLIAFAGVAGQDLIGLLSGNKWPGTGFLFAGFMVTLIPLSQQQLLETLAVVTGNSILCVRAAAVGLVMPLVLYGLVTAGFGLWAPVIALGAGHVLYNGAIVLGLINRVDYRGDSAGFGKLLGAAILAFFLAALVPGTQPPLMGIVVKGVVAFGLFLLVAWMVRPFGEVERTRLNGLLPRRWFIW